jgi:hypothetical protein
MLDAPVGLSEKIPIALDLRSAFDQASDGRRPDLRRIFDAHGAASNPQLAAARDEVVGVVESTVTRAFRPAFLLSAVFAALAFGVARVFRRRLLT